MKDGEEQFVEQVLTEATNFEEAMATGKTAYAGAKGVPIDEATDRWEIMYNMIMNYDVMLKKVGLDKVKGEFEKAKKLIKGAGKFGADKGHSAAMELYQEPLRELKKFHKNIGQAVDRMESIAKAK